MKSKPVRFGRAIVLSILFLLTLFSLFARHASPGPAWHLVHCWAGALLLIGSGVHLGSNLGWVRAVFSRPAEALQAPARTNRQVDLGLLITGVVCALSALPHPNGLQTISSSLHAISGLAMALLTLVHLWLHRQWMANTARQLRTPRLAVEGLQPPKSGLHHS